MCSNLLKDGITGYQIQKLSKAGVLLFGNEKYEYILSLTVIDTHGKATDEMIAE